MALNILTMVDKNLLDDAVCFSVMADECTDITNENNLQFVLDW